MSPAGGGPKWTAERVANLASTLYAPTTPVAERKRTDKELSSFQHSDYALNVSLTLLADVDTLFPIGREAASAVVLLLAQIVHKRCRSPKGYKLMKDPLPVAAKCLRFAEVLHANDAKPAKLLARAAAALWIRTGSPPVEEILTAMPTAAPVKQAIALAAITALPEEAACYKEQSGGDQCVQVKAQIVRWLASIAGRILDALAFLTNIADSERLEAAAAWIRVVDSSEFIPRVGTSSLVPLALQSAAEAAVAAENVKGTAACDFLDAVLKLSESSPLQKLMPLVDLVLVLVSAANLDVEPARRVIGRFVADAILAWGGHFIKADTMPPAQWQQLIAVFVSCISWGLEPAMVTLPAWLTLHSMAVKSGALGTYRTVFSQVTRAFRVCSRFPQDYASWSMDRRDAFREFRDEVRDLLRTFVDQEALHGFLAEVCPEVMNYSAGNDSWQHREEALHALSAVAQTVQKGITSTTSDVTAALAVLACLGDATRRPVEELTCHRQLLCSFLVCSSVYVPALALPHRWAGVADAMAPALGRVLEIARLSLSVQQEVSAGDDVAFPFRAKQDHAGAVCILKLCMGCAKELAGGDLEVFSALRRDHALHLANTMQKSLNSLCPHAMLVLTQSLCMVAVHKPELVAGVLSDCLSAVAESPNLQSDALIVALDASAEVFRRCREQPDALGTAINSNWPAVAKACETGEIACLGRLLCYAAEAVPAESLPGLTQLVACTFERRADSRVELLGVAASIAHRKIDASPVPAALLSELLLGFSHLLWTQMDGSTALVGQRQSLLVDNQVWHADAAAEQPAVFSVSEAECRLMDAWTRSVCEVGQHAPQALAGDVVSMTLATVSAYLALPHSNPPAKPLALVAASSWNDECLKSKWKSALEGVAGRGAASANVAIGALILRGLLKALLGQMPVTAVGVIMPATRALLEIAGPICFASWLSQAVQGDTFPRESMSKEAKQRFVTELAASGSNQTNFKQLLKRFCKR